MQRSGRARALALRPTLRMKTSRGSDAPLPRSYLSPFDEARVLGRDEGAGTGRIEAVRRNRFDDWFYDCHFRGDPVMPGCWGVDAVWQCLRSFAARRGLPDLRPVGMEDARFFGQIRPHDSRIVYAVDVLKIEESEGDWLVSGRAEVAVDGRPVYTIGSAQVGTAFWSGEGRVAMPSAAPDEGPSAPLSYAQFRALDKFSHAQLVAISHGTLVADPPGELGLLPSGPMLQVGRVLSLERDEAAGTGTVTAIKENDPREWHYDMNRGRKPAALSIDGVWQLMGLFSSWSGDLGTGRALGFERVELFDDVLPEDGRILYELKVTRRSRAAGGDAALRADAKVYADGRPILSCVNASVGCHQGIRYAGYPHQGLG